MAHHPVVHISGFLCTQISSILLSEKGDSEGILYGKTFLHSSSTMDDSNDTIKLSIHIHINGFQLASNTPSAAFHDSQGTIDWSKIMDCHQKKNKYRRVEEIIGIFKCRLGVPNKPTLRDRFTLRSFANTLSSTVNHIRLGVDKYQEKGAVEALGSPVILGLFTGSMDANNLMLQDMGFYHVPSAGAAPSTHQQYSTDSLGNPLGSCKIKILNLAPLVQDNLEIDYNSVNDNDQEKNEQDELLLHDQRKVWIGIHNQIFDSIAKAREGKEKISGMGEKLESILL